MRDASAHGSGDRRPFVLGRMRDRAPSTRPDGMDSPDLDPGPRQSAGVSGSRASAVAGNVCPVSELAMEVDEGSVSADSSCSTTAPSS
jgi:hypothetical protein